MRYSVILIATTCGSATAWLTNVSTAENESNGWCTQPILLADLVEHAACRDARRPTACAERRARPSACGIGSRCSAIQSENPSRSRSRDVTIVVFDLEILDEDLQHPPRHGGVRPAAATAAPCRSCFRLWSTDSSRSSAPSSCISMSVSRMMRNRCASTTSTLGKQLVQVQPDDVLEKRERRGRPGS